jgi:hypothetical protein
VIDAHAFRHAAGELEISIDPEDIETTGDQ